MSDIDKIYYDYIYLDPRKPGTYRYQNLTFDNEPFYVGKGHDCRDKSHLNIKEDINRSLPNKIRKIYKETGCEPIILRYKENLLESVSFDLEIELIAIIGRKDLGLGPLLNLTDGGEGPSGAIVSDKTRKIFSEQRKGKPRSEETKAKISKVHKGKIVSKETRGKLSEANKGHVPWNKGKKGVQRCSEETKKKIGAANKGNVAWNKGKSPSLETRLKISAALKECNRRKHK